MANILFTVDSTSYLMTSLQDRLKKVGHEVIVSKADINQLADVQRELSAIVLYMDDEMLGKEQELVYLKDKAAEEDVPVFAVGSPEELEFANKIIPSFIMKKTFTRPINVRDLVDILNGYLKSQAGEAKKKILVVDDSPEMLRSIKDWLSEKYRVVLASSGMMAIKYLVLNKPDLILLDYDMPVVDGRQVLEMIRTEIEYTDIPVIFLTGKGDRESVTKVLGLHPDGYLLKSMGRDAVVQSIDDFFDKKRIEKLNI